MAVAPLSTEKYPYLSDWSTEPPQTSQETPSQTVNNVNQNPAGLISNQQQSTSIWLPVVLGLTVGLLCGGVALGAIVTLWLTGSTTTTTTTTAATTTTAIPILTAFWSFDNNTNDEYNNYNAMAVNSPTYVTGYTGFSNTALNFNAASSQYVTVASPFLNLTYKSFTVEMWFYPTTLTSGDYGLFGQCQNTSIDHCLVYLIRNYCVYLAFYSDDQSGVTTISTNTWYHVAFVYDYSTSIQSLYLNGVLEGNRSSNPYKGTSGPILIGAVDHGGRSYFTGRLDYVSLVARAKTATEILNDATLVCYYSLDSSSYSDSGPLGLTGSGVSISTGIGMGRVNDAISFASVSSYFVVGGFTKLGTPQSYSISIWIQPTSVSGGTILHVASCNYGCNPTWCLAFIGLTSGGQIVIQSWSTVGSNLVSLTGPVLSINVWTHVVQTFSSNNGMRLYVNGLLLNQSSPFTYLASNTPNYLYLGSFPWPACAGPNTISMGQYYGLLDEFRVFSREITATEVYALANP